MGEGGEGEGSVPRPFASFYGEGFVSLLFFFSFFLAAQGWSRDGLELGSAMGVGSSKLLITRGWRRPLSLGGKREPGIEAGAILERVPFSLCHLSSRAVGSLDQTKTKPFIFL